MAWCQHLEELEPHRLTETWGIHNHPDIINSLAESGTPIVVSISRALRRGLVDEASAYPLRTLVGQQGPSAFGLGHA